MAGFASRRHASALGAQWPRALLSGAAGTTASGAASDVAMMAVPIESGSGFRAGNPIRLFSGSYFAGLSGRTYDVSADGQRFLMIKDKATGPAATNRIIVVENLFEELKRRAPILSGKP